MFLSYEKYFLLLMIHLQTLPKFKRDKYWLSGLFAEIVELQTMVL